MSMPKKGVAIGPQDIPRQEASGARLLPTFIVLRFICRIYQQFTSRIIGIRNFHARQYGDFALLHHPRIVVDFVIVTL